MKDTLPGRYTIVILVILVFALFPSSPGFSEDPEKNLPAKSVKEGAVNPNLQTALQETMDAAQQSSARARQLASEKGLEVSNNRIEVIIEPRGGNPSRVNVPELESLGAEVQATSDKLIRATVPFDRLSAVSREVQGVEFVRTPRRPTPLKVDTSGGVSKTGGDDYQSAGFSGQNVKVAIIDVGFSHLTEAQESGDLPSEVVTYKKDYTGGNVESGPRHGTDVAEIVHDMAPEAEIYLMKVGDSLDLQNAKDDAISEGVDVINHSVGWFNTSFYDGTGFVSEIAADARENNILWVNAAGNAANTHWQGDFEDTNDNDWHEFSGDDECNGLGTIGSGNTINIYLTWNAWPSDAEDYDLYLLNDEEEIVARSDDYQNGTQSPTEFLSYQVTTKDQYCFAVVNRDAPSTPELEVFLNLSIGSPPMEYYTEESSIMDPANDPKVLTVGAINESSWTSGPQEYFSSQGPTNDSKFAEPRTKPDVMAPDGVSTSGYGTFYGTSASSPHVAGAAALLLSENPDSSLSEVESTLENETVDMGTTGKDNVYGAGRLNMGVEVSMPPVIPDLSAELEGKGEVSLSWTNPTDEDFSGVVVRRKTGEYPADHQDGVLVYENDSASPGNTVTHTDSDLDPGATYYYAAFGRNEAGSWNESVTEESNASSVEVQQIASVQVNEGGWSMISFPLTPSDSDPGSVFRGMSNESDIYHWEPSGSGDGGKFLAPGNGLNSVQAMEGYWIYLNDGEVPNSFQVSGNGENTGEIVLENKGWHQIGLPVNYDWSDVGVKQGADGKTMTVAEQSDGPDAPHWMSRFIWDWSLAEVQYMAYDAKSSAKTLTTGDGYWVRTRVDDVRLVIPFEASAASDSSDIKAGGDGISMSSARAERLDIPTPPGPPRSASSFNEELEVVASPSPVKSNDTVNFRVPNQNPDSLQATVYSSSGELIFESSWENGNELAWDLVDEEGKPVPNGLYLYSVTARKNGRVLTSSVNKLLLLN